mgnify:CR=1 FL=1
MWPRPPSGWPSPASSTASGSASTAQGAIDLSRFNEVLKIILDQHVGPDQGAVEIDDERRRRGALRREAVGVLEVLQGLLELRLVVVVDHHQRLALLHLRSDLLDFGDAHGVVDLAVILILACAEQVDTARRQQIIEASEHSQRPFQNPPGVAAANSVFPVVEKISIPLRGLVAILLLWPLGLGREHLPTAAFWWQRLVFLAVPGAILLGFLRMFGRFERPRNG